MTSPWPFSTRGTRMSTQANFQPLEPLDPRQFSEDDAVIKIKLTEPVSAAIDLISLENGNSRPDVVRAILFEHIYGAAALVQFAEWRREQWADEDDYMAVHALSADTRRNANFDTMGKANEDFKLHLPEIMRTDLERLAEATEQSLSAYCRRVLVAHLFGVRHVMRWQEIG